MLPKLNWFDRVCETPLFYLNKKILQILKDLQKSNYDLDDIEMLAIIIQDADLNPLHEHILFKELLNSKNLSPQKKRILGDKIIEDFENQSLTQIERESIKRVVQQDSIIEAEEAQQELDNKIVELEEKEEDILKNGDITIESLHKWDEMSYAIQPDLPVVKFLVLRKVKIAINGLIKKKADFDIKKLQKETGGPFFQMIKDKILEIWNKVINFKLPEGYRFPYQPTNMQKLLAVMIEEEKRFLNLGGPGAGKTLSAILASRKVKAKLTFVVVINHTENQWKKEIKMAFPNTRVEINPKTVIQYNRDKPTYIICSYSKFQNENFKYKFLDPLAELNKIDFIIIDEIHLIKHRNETKEESNRRKLIVDFIGSIKKKNPDPYILGMTATPVVNGFIEAKTIVEIVTGEKLPNVSSKTNVNNALILHMHLVNHGIRFQQEYPVKLKETTININAEKYVNDLKKAMKGKTLEREMFFIKLKLKSSGHLITKGTIVYIEYINRGIFDYVQKFIKNQGLTVGAHYSKEKEGLKDFMQGKVDVLLASPTIRTGIDGLQDVSNKIYVLNLPWTYADYEQLKHRILRLNSTRNCEIIIPVVSLSVSNFKCLTYDERRKLIVDNKKEISLAGVDGIFQKEKLGFNEQQLAVQTSQSLDKWIDRIERAGIIKIENGEVEYSKNIKQVEEFEKRTDSEFTEMHRVWNNSTSTTLHKRIKNNPKEWEQYHNRLERCKLLWEKTPTEHIFEKLINVKRSIIVDCGCGRNELVEKLKPLNKGNTFFSFDHYAKDKNVIPADIKDLSLYLEDDSVDFAIYSLALMGTNNMDYLEESYRFLKPGNGVIIIVEPLDKWKNKDFSKFLMDLRKMGFQLHEPESFSGKFKYIKGTKGV